MTIRDRLIHQLTTLKYSGLSAAESRRLSDYLRQVSATLTDVQQAATHTHTGNERAQARLKLNGHRKP